MSQAAPDILIPQRKSVAENIATVKESLGEIVHTERELLQASVARGKKHVQNVQTTVEGYVRDKPVRSLLVAAGAGAMLGYLLGRRR